MLNELLNIELVNYQNDVTRFEYMLAKTRTLFQQTDELITGINRVLKFDFSGNYSLSEVSCGWPEMDNKGADNEIIVNNDTKGNVGSIPVKDPDGGQVLNTVQGMIQLAEQTIKVTESFGKLTPELKNVKREVGLMSSFKEGFGGIADMVSMASKGYLLAEGEADANKIVDGAAGLLAVEGSIGSVGWVAAGVTLVDGIISANEEENKIKEEKMQEQKNVPRTLLSFVISETEANGYLNGMHKPNNEQFAQWRINSNPVLENQQKFGSGSYDLNIPVPVAISDIAVSKNLAQGIYKTNKDKIAVKQSYHDQTFEMQQQLNYAGWMGGKQVFNQQVLKDINDAKKYDEIHHTNTLSEVDGAIEEAFANLLGKANEGRYFPVSERNPSYSSGNQRRPEQANTSGGKVININLNKAMVENFIIHANNVTDGLNDFKQKVEEVLLEILNSANAIQ